MERIGITTERERSGERPWKKIAERERSGERTVGERERSNLSHISMAEGEVTSRQDGGAHTWDVDAAAAGDGMTRSVVRRSYLRLRARPTGQPTCPVARGPGPARST
jgi:hypothetical protein